ncbi:ABC transporter permease subunit [Halobiforma nitratireducens]|uniref:ABC transporter n=1 Tax=Halobiforma nitratireducens JCM 10879 TaxID=1227454 RepID=M0LSH5_9EURY|nr:ABC transporter permease subunit [Halobiforma nitratireducens]EMA35379.1 hypothetical protein C446_12984 [Halobiforma nitratireducens JCM 10879]
MSRGRGWRLIARKEIGDAVRNRQLYSNAAMFALLFGFMAYIYADAGGSPPAELVGFLSALSIVLVPAVGLMIAYSAIVKRRSDGQLTLLLGMPHDRRDVVIGSYLGRAAVLLVALVVGVAAAALVAVLFGSELSAVALSGFFLATAALGVSYVAIAICLSALTRDQTWASIGAFVAFLLFVLAWRYVPTGIAYAFNGFELPAAEPWWFPYVEVLSPSVAYEQLLEVVAEVGGYATGDGLDRTLSAVAAASLLGWCILAPAVGYLQFARSDL